MPTRNRETDACPGVLATHQAADGAVARVRVPGGQLTPSAFQAIAAGAAELGDGTIELTSRANLQVRGLSDGDELSTRLASVGLLPSATHERVRNILGSPLTGRDGAGFADVRPLVAELDRALCAHPGLAELPGRFLFALDDGRGDVAWLGADVAAVLISENTAAILLGGEDGGLRTPGEGVVAIMLACAEAFLTLRTTEWRLAEMTDGPHRIATALECSEGHPQDTQHPKDAPHDIEPAAEHPKDAPPGTKPPAKHPKAPPHNTQPTAEHPKDAPPGTQPAAKHPKDAAYCIEPAAKYPAAKYPKAPVYDTEPDAAGAKGALRDIQRREGALGIGLIAQGGGLASLVVGAPLGWLDQTQAAALVETGAPLVVTPWKRIVVADLEQADPVADRLREVGLLLDPDDPLARVTACTGRPGCAQALADVRADAKPIPGTTLPVHWAGCERRCGRPRGTVVDVVATGDGYRVTEGDR